MIEIIKASETIHYNQIEILANTIWKEHYIPIIGKPQVDYMLQKFQSSKAIREQSKNGFEYYLLVFEKTEVGYISVKKEKDSLFLSKIYVMKPYRGQGIGKKAMKFIESKALELNCKSIHLTVNRNNTNSIEAYKNLGFKNLGNVVIDIGNGFTMDDFKMAKTLD